MKASAELMFKDVTEQAALVRGGQVSALELVDAAIARLEGARELNVLVHGSSRPRGRPPPARCPTGPLAGVPFLLKDLGEPQAGVPERMGSRALRDHVATETAWTVDRYLAGGPDHLRAHQHAGVRQPLRDRAGAVRADAESVGPELLAGRVERRLGRRRRRRAGRRRLGRGRHRLDPDAVVLLRAGRAQAARGRSSFAPSAGQSARRAGQQARADADACATPRCCST